MEVSDSEMDISSSDETTTKFSSDSDSSLERSNKTKQRSVLYRDKYDAFLAHSKVDAEFVESVMDTLEKRGVSCCYSRKDFRPGTSTVTCIDEALEKSTFVICFISKDFLTSPWCKHERDMALHKAAEKSEDIIVPILLDVSLEDLYMNIRRLTHIRRDDTNFEKKLFFSLGVPEGISRPTYSDLENENAELKAKLKGAQRVIKMKDGTLAQHEMQIEKCKARCRKLDVDMAYLKQQYQDLQQKKMLKDAELKEMKTKLTHCLKMAENTQQKLSNSERQVDDIHDDPKNSRNVVEEFSCLLSSGKTYAKMSRSRDVINTLKDAERIVKENTNNSIPENMIFDMLELLWTAHRSLGDYQTSIRYCKEAISYQHRLSGCVNEKIPECYFSYALAHELWGGLDRAETFYRLSIAFYKILCRKPDCGNVTRDNLSRTLRCLGRTYMKQGNIEAARQYLSNALDEEVKLHSQDDTHPHILETRSLLAQI